MARYILTKQYSVIEERRGILQNLSGDSNVEVTANVNEAGIILKPFQTLTIDTKVCARQSGGSGTCQLMVLPFENLKNHSETNIKPHHGLYRNPYDDFEDDFFKEESPIFSNQPLSVQETKSHFLIGISKESLKGQKKFLIQFEE